MNSNKGIKNVIFGLLSQLLSIAIGVFIPRLVIVNLGSEANGLLSSVGNILAYLALLEAGVGTASLQALYKPIATENRDSINGIMSATHYFYKRTGYIYLACVLVMSVAYTIFINSDLPRIEIFIIALMAGLTGVISYFFQGKITIFLQAEGKRYVTSNIATMVSVGTSIAKAIALVCGANVIVIQAIHFILSLIQMLIYIVYFKRNYGWVDFNAAPDFEAISQKKAVLIHQISGLIFSNTDVLLLTFFVSLKAVSVYNMYAMVYGMVKSLTIMFSESFVHELGQSFHDKPKFMRRFDSYEIMNMALTFSLFCIAKVLMIPFMKLYTAGVEDINYVDSLIAWEFVIYYLLHNARNSSGHVISIAQKFEDTKWRSILESVINVCVSLALTNILGIYGVLLGTIAALLYRANDMIIYAAHVLERSPWVTYRRWLRNAAIFATVILITDGITLDLSNYGSLFVYGIALTIIVIPLFFFVNFVCEPDVGKYTASVVKSIVFKKSGEKDSPAEYRNHV